MNTVEELINVLKTLPPDAIIKHGDKTLIDYNLNIDERDKINGKPTVSLYFRKYLIITARV